MQTKLDKIATEQRDYATGTSEVMANTEARLKTLEEKFEALQQSSSNSSSTVVASLDCSDSTWKANLAKEIFDAWVKI